MWNRSRRETLSSFAEEATVLAREAANAGCEELAREYGRIADRLESRTTRPQERPTASVVSLFGANIPGAVPGNGGWRRE